MGSMSLVGENPVFWNFATFSKLNSWLYLLNSSKHSLRCSNLHII